MKHESKQAQAVGLLYDALGVIHNIPEEKYKYMPEVIEVATSIISEAVDIVANDLVEKE